MMLRESPLKASATINYLGNSTTCDVHTSNMAVICYDKCYDLRGVNVCSCEGIWL